MATLLDPYTLMVVPPIQVLYPRILFLIFITDLADANSSPVDIYANNTTIYALFAVK